MGCWVLPSGPSSLITAWKWIRPRFRYSVTFAKDMRRTARAAF